MSTLAGSLTGITVLDLTRILPGPFASMILADLGADVIKVEHPRGGDPERSSEPLGPDGLGYRFGMLNRGKRSIAVDLKDPEARTALLRLAETADVFIEGFRPGVAASLGVGPEEVAALNPQIVYCSLSGYGQSGPYALLPGHDINYMAMAGLLRYFGGRHAPMIPWLPIADIGGGATLAVSGILAALLARERTGMGDVLDLGMAEGALYWQQTRAQWALATGADPEPAGIPTTGSLPGYGVYECREDTWLSLGCMEPVFWQNLCSLLELPDEDRQRQRDPAARDGIESRLRERIRTNTASEWFDLMRARDVPAAPCLSIKEALDDEHFRNRGLVGGADGYDSIRAPFRFNRARNPVPRPAPPLGHDTDSVLEGIGVPSATRQAMRARGAIA